MRRSYLVVSLLILANILYAQKSPDPVEMQIDSLFSRYNVSTPGVAVAVVKDGKIILQKGYGIANLEYDIPITPATVFHVASVSKQFTAFSIYLLEKQGKLSLDDDIRKYIPELPDFGRTVRIKHLLAHTSGIRDQWALLTLAGWRMDDVITTEHILKILSRQQELNFEPGSQFGYSNSGFTLLAEVVTRVSGKSFPAFTKESIFDPLGMTNTLFYDDFEKIVKNRAYSYEIKDGQYRKKNLNYSNAGATSLFTTVEDLSKWAMNFQQPVVGDAELIARFNEPSTLNNGQRVLHAVIEGDSSFHAKGQLIRNYRGVDVYNHSGHDAGFRTFLIRIPDKHLSIITLSNDEHYEAYKNGLTITTFYLKNDLKEKAVLPGPVATGDRNEPVRKYSNDLKELEGRFYSEELNTDYLVKAKDGRLELHHTRLSNVALKDTGKDTFSGTIEFPVDVDFTRNSSNVVTGMRISNFGARNVWFKKIPN